MRKRIGARTFLWNQVTGSRVQLYQGPWSNWWKIRQI